MKRAFALLAFVVSTVSIGSAQTVSPLAAPTGGVLLAAGTPVSFALVVPLSSANARAGDVFQIYATQNVVSEGYVVVRQSSGGQGHIVKADGAGGNGHSGSLVLAMDYINASDGSRVKLSDSAQKLTEDDRKGATSTLTIVGLATFGLSGLFAHNFAQGHQKVIKANVVLTTFVAENTHVATLDRAP